MAERFGSQDHPSGGLRFGSQEYEPLAGVVAGALHAVETQADVFVADSYPRITGSVAAIESGTDGFSAHGTSSLLFTMQAHESPTPDTFVATGAVTINLGGLRFGSQDHPSGGLRFGSQSWAALGPNGPLAASESGDDIAAVAGFLLVPGYTFAGFEIAGSFVNYSSESLGAAITGTLDTGHKVALPITAPGGIAFEWEVNEHGNPSLRLARMTGATLVSGVPWYVWDGAAWTLAHFDVSDAIQGAAFLVESGLDVASFRGDRNVIGSVPLSEVGDDALAVAGRVAVRGSLAAIESGADVFAASGAPGYAGYLYAAETGEDVAEIAGGPIITGDAEIDEEGDDTFAAVARIGVAGVVDAIESGADTLASTGFLINGGALAATESDSPDEAEIEGEVAVRGVLVSSEAGADAFESTGELYRWGLIALQESGADAMDAAGEVSIRGQLNALDELDRFECFGTRESTGDVVAAEVDALEGGTDRFVSRGRVGELVTFPTISGPVETASSTRVVVVRSRRTAEAA